MSDVSFPLKNIRRNIDGSWSLVLITESIFVPLYPPYIIRLKELPDNGLIEDLPYIDGLTISTTYPPNPGHCFINYDTGYVEFNLSQAGNIYNIIYWGKGYLMDYDHINWLYDHLSDVDCTGNIGDIAVFVDTHSLRGTKNIDLGTF